MGNSGTIGAFAAGCPTDIGGKSFAFPKSAGLRHLTDLTIWIGAIVGSDTLVSAGFDGWQNSSEMAPDEAPFGLFRERSIHEPDDPENANAVSEQDFICSYFDTLVGNDFFYQQPDFFRKGPHIPLGIKVDQESYAWSYGYAEDILFVQLNITNIGKNILRELFLGIYIDGDVGEIDYYSQDDITGFLNTHDSRFGCGFVDTIQTAWIADNDGDPVDGEWVERASLDQARSSRNVLGAKILEPPAKDAQLSYNWWLSSPDPNRDYGPMQVEKFRDFRTGGMGTPEGDRNKYYLLSNRDFDHDQIYTDIIPPWDSLWLKPNPEYSAEWAMGADTRFMLSYGAYNLYPGDNISIAFAIMGGENFHTTPFNLNFMPDRPGRFYDNLDFSDLALNAMWAEWIYDNPGVDTDGDGDFGDFRVCVYDSVLIDGEWVASVADTQWYRGDGVPDWRGAGPPPAPVFWLEPQLNGVRVRFNGYKSETTKDIFLNMIDFEGYRIYIARDELKESFSLLESMDNENFDKYVWNDKAAPKPAFELQDIPMALVDIQCLYADCDENFDPLDYTVSDPFYHPDFIDSIFYFVKHDYNRDISLGLTNIHKVYPAEPRPDPADTLDPDKLTDEGYLKYYEYEFFIDNLLPTVPYWINVTAFDFGSPKAGLTALETSRTNGAKKFFPYADQNQTADTLPPVYVYPNPYRIDGGYRSHGFEGRTHDDLPPDKVRAIYFVNLPPRCTIKIFTLDGDLVKEIDHDVPISDPTYTHDYWDMITRNRQTVVSGLYYWTVEAPSAETQIGKLVVIR